MKKHNHKGFAGLTILLVLAVVLAIAGIGGYLYVRRPAVAPVVKPAVGAPTGQSTSPNGIPGGATGSTTSGTPAASGTVVKVTETGFQITVPDSLKDLTYHVHNGVVSFSTATLTAAEPNCAATHGTGAFDMIVRGDGTYQPPANPADGGLLKQYGGYYLAYVLPSGPCAKGLSVANQNLLDDQAQAFYGSLSTVTAL